MKKIILFVAILLNFNVYAQEERIVTLVVTGQGMTADEARQNALRSAIEQAFGSFISSKAEVLNDKLVKDEIVSVSNGNIKKYEILNETMLQTGAYVSTLNASVSIGKLISFCESKGVIVEFGGELFAYNLRLKKLNQEKELFAMRNLRIILNQISSLSFDYQIKTNDPTNVNGDATGMWFIKSNIFIIPNNNFTKLIDILYKTIKALSIPKSEIENYQRQNIIIYPVWLTEKFLPPIYLRQPERIKEPYEILYFRNNLTLALLVEIILDLQKAIYNFKIENGISTISGKEIQTNFYCVNSSHSGYKNGNGIIENRGACPGRFGFTESDDRITIIGDMDILQYHNAEWPFLNHIPYRLLTNLKEDELFWNNNGKKELLLNFLNAIQNGLGLYLKGLSERAKFEIQIKEKRSEEEIMKIKHYQITPYPNLIK